MEPDLRKGQEPFVGSDGTEKDGSGSALSIMRFYSPSHFAGYDILSLRHATSLYNHWNSAALSADIVS
jgi:hypothetical protein